VILETIDEVSEAVLAAERIVEAFERPFLVGNRSLAITTSIGVVLGRASQDTPADLLRYADVALYQAKEAGKARYAVFDTAMSEVFRNVESKYLALGRRDPLIDFLRSWLWRHVPERTRPAFVTWDSAQFLQHDGELVRDPLLLGRLSAFAEGRL